MTILSPTTCWIIGVSGWKLYQSVTFIGSLPTAGLMSRQPGPAAGKVPSPPRGPLATTGVCPGILRPFPSPAVLGSVMKIQPELDGGSCGEPCGLPPLGMGPLGHGLARTSVTACTCTAVATSESYGHVWVAPLGSTK